MGTCASAEASPTVSPLPVKPSGNQPSRKLGSIGGSGSNGSRSASIDMAVEAGGGAVSRRLLSAMGVVASELDPLRAQERIVTEAISILGCDRATIFRVDALRKELTLHLAEQDLDIRVPFGKGIAGWVAQQGEVANIADAYTDGRFEKQADMDSGYKTTSVLCAPIRSPAGDTVAVLQAINKTRGPCFTAEDQAVLEQLSVLAGISLRNAKLYQDALRQQQKTSALVEVVRCLSADMGVQSLILTITTRAPALVGAAACTLYLVDHRQNQLWSVATDSGKEFRIPRNAGIAGHVATSGEVVNIPDCYSDDRFNQDSDKKSGFTTRSMLVAPLSKQGGEAGVIGVLQLINSEQLEGFSEEDETLIATFCDLVAGHIESSQLYTSAQKSPTKEGEVHGDGRLDAGDSWKEERASRKTSTLASFGEEEEEEEEMSP